MDLPAKQTNTCNKTDINIVYQDNKLALCENVMEPEAMETWQGTAMI